MSDILDKNHDDWVWPFSYIPRSWTAVKSDTPPTELAKSDDLNKAPDVPNPGAWAVTTSQYGINFAATTDSGWHFRIGTFRYDYVDKYYTFPTFTIKKLK